MSEFDVLVEQLEELLIEAIVDSDDALEVAVVAGLLYRLDAGPSVLTDAVAFRDGEGADLLDEAFDDADLEDFVEAIDGLVGADEMEVEEVLSDFDDFVAAAVWCDQTERVGDAARRVAAIVRQVPDPFLSLVNTANRIASLPAVGRQVQLYDYWFAIAEGSRWLDESDSF